MKKEQIARTSARLAWLVLLSLCGYYLYRAIRYRFLTPGQLGPTLFNKQIWYYTHLASALPVLIGAPIQFIPSLRVNKPHVHRLIGRLYVFGATIAGITAIYLGAIGEYEGSRLPIVLLGCLWLFFTLSAWRTAVQSNFVAHRLFMIRSYCMALVLVWLRILDDLPWSILFFYIKDQTIRETTVEWMSWVLPLIAIEFWLTWRPLLTGKKSRQAAT